MKHIIKVFVLLSAITFSIPQTYSQVLVSASLSIRVAPPMLQVYSQPPCPVDGYLWSPGYWAYDSDGYYWVDGEWVLPPAEGLLWTPGYWSFSGGYYGWQAGYWGSEVGFYGGVNYGYGYSGQGYNGGRWQGGHFRYNTAVANVNHSVIHNTYVNRSGVNNSGRNRNRKSFNGPGGITARPSPHQQTAMHEKHMQPTSQQSSHVRTTDNPGKSYSSSHEKRVVPDAKKSTGTTHTTKRTATTHKVHNISSQSANVHANMQPSASKRISAKNRTLETIHTTNRPPTQSHNTAPRSPHVQQQHTMHAPAHKPNAGDNAGKKGDDKHH